MLHAKWFAAAVAAGCFGVAAAQGAGGGGAGVGAGTNSAASAGTEPSPRTDMGGSGTESDRGAGSTDPRKSERTTPGTDQEHSGVGAAQGSGTGSISTSDMTTTLASMHAGNQAEIQAGQWMQQHATNSKVKDFAKKMVDDHRALDKDGQGYAQKHDLDLTSAPDYQSKMQEHQSMLDQLKSTQGAELDRQYMQMMVQDHQRDTSEVRAALAQAKSSNADKDYTRLLDKAQSKMSDHLKDAQKISRDLGSRQARNPSNQ